MPNRPHTTHDCDEDCRGCTTCYLTRGASKCDWNCPHTAETHADEIEELADEDDSELAQWERARDTAEEPRR